MEVSDSYTVASTESLQTRIQYYLVKNAVTIAAEDPLTDTRQRLVRAILENRLSIHNVTLMVLSNSTIAAMADPTTVTDSALASTVGGLTASLSLIV